MKSTQTLVHLNTSISIETFSKVPVSSVLQGETIASNSNVLSLVNPLSCFDDITRATEIVQAKEGLETIKTIGVEISDTFQIVGKYLNMHSADLSAPAGPLALKYVDTEVQQNCNKQEIVLVCTTEYPFVFKVAGKSEEEYEEAIRKNPCRRI